MGAGAFLEPLAVVVLLFGGAWINREPNVARSHPRRNSAPYSLRREDEEDGDGLLNDPSDPILKSTVPTRVHSPSLIAKDEEGWRKRSVGFWRWSAQLETPNTTVFRNRMLSRLLHKFPFLVECWYWALVYWVCFSSSPVYDACFWC